MLTENESFFGRKTDLTQFGEFLTKDLPPGKFSSLLISGDAGIGKTRLSQHGLASVNLMDTAVLFPVHLPNVIYSLLSLLFASDKRHLFSEQITPFMAVSLNGYHPAVRTLATEHLKMMPKRIPAEDDISVKEAILILLNKFSQHKKPLIIAAEDLHRADETDLSVMTFLLDNADRLNAGLKMIICSREHELNSKQRRFIQKYCRANSAIQLKGLLKDEVSQWLNYQFGTAFMHQNQSFLNKIFALTDGNPLHINQLLQKWTDEKVIYQKKGHWQFKSNGWKKEQNIELNSLIKNRINAIQNKNRTAFDLLRLIAFNRFEFTAKDYRSLLALSLQKYNRVTKYLEKNQLITDEAAFTHPLYPEIILSSVNLVDKHEIHLKIAQYLETKNEKNFVLLAKAYEHTKPKTKPEKRRLIKVLKKAVDAFEDEWNFSNHRVRWLMLMLKYSEDGLLNAKTELQLAYIFAVTGKVRRAERLLKKLQNYDNSEIRFQILDLQISLENNRGQYKEAMALTEQAIKIAKQSSNREMQIGFLQKKMDLAGSLQDNKKLTGTFAHLKRARFNTRRLKFVKGRYFQQLCNYKVKLGKWDDVNPIAEKMLKFGRKNQLPYISGLAYTYLTYYALVYENFSEAEKQANLAQNCFEAYGSLFAIGDGKGLLGQTLLHSGKPEKAIHPLKESLQIAEYQKTPHLTQKPLLNLLMALEKAGQKDEALTLYRKHERRFKQIGNAYYLTHFLVHFGELLADLGKVKMAVKKLEAGFNSAYSHNLVTLAARACQGLGDLYMTQYNDGYADAYLWLQKAYDICYSKDEYIHQRKVTLTNILICCYYLENKKGLKKWTEVLKAALKRNENRKPEFDLALLCFTSENPDIKLVQYKNKSIKNDDLTDLGLNYFFRALTVYHVNGGKRMSLNTINHLSNLLLCAILVIYRSGQTNISWLKKTKLKNFRLKPTLLLTKETKTELLLSLLKHSNSLDLTSTANFHFIPSLVRFGNDFLKEEPELNRTLFPDEVQVWVVSRLVQEIIQDENSKDKRLYDHLKSGLKLYGIHLAELKKRIKIKQAEILTFGGLYIHIKGKARPPIEWSGQTKKLFEYILCKSLFKGHGARRTELEELLWRDGGAGGMQNRLKQALFRLRKLFAEIECSSSMIIYNRAWDSYIFKTGDDVYCDVIQFSEHFQRGETARLNNTTHTTIAEFEMAVPMYSGGFLETEDEIWSQTIKEKLHTMYSSMINTLCSFYFARKDFVMTYHYAETFKSLYPLDEMGIFWCIKGLQGQKRISSAKTLYNRWKRDIMQELELKPAFTFSQIKQFNSFKEIWE